MERARGVVKTHCDLLWGDGDKKGRGGGGWRIEQEEGGRRSSEKRKLEKGS